MTVDVFNPPRPELSSVSLASRREHFLSEIERDNSQRGLYRRARQRPLLVLLFVIVLVAIPVSAFAVTGTTPWWFLQGNFRPLGYGPAKGTSVVVVKRGTWDGQGWVLTAFRSQTGSLCFQFTRSTHRRPSAAGVGSAAGCGAMIGSTVSHPGEAPSKLTITYLSSGGGAPKVRGNVRYIVGPVVSSATEVVIHLANGTIIRTPTFAAPKALGIAVRFYATPLPAAPIVSATPPSCLPQAFQLAGVAPIQLVGLDHNGRIVASLRRAAGTIPRCSPPRTRQLFPGNLSPEATGSIKPVLHITAPYGATAILALGKTVPIPEATRMANGQLKHFTALSRCWKVTFSNGDRQGTCSPQARASGSPPFNYLEVDHVGHAVFVIVEAPAGARPAVSRITLGLAHGKKLSARPIDGLAVFAIPKANLTAKSQRSFVTSFDSSNNRIGRQPVYYRSCPSATASGGVC